MGETQQLASVVEGQFECAWDMLRETIEAFTDETWRAGDIAYLTPGRIAYHIIETVDYYGRNDLDAFCWGHRAGIDWEAVSNAGLPSQTETLAYLEDVREANRKWLHKPGNDVLLANDIVFHNEGMTHLDRALYVLRHIHQHLGELCGELRRRELPRPGWR